MVRPTESESPQARLSIYSPYRQKKRKFCLIASPSSCQSLVASLVFDIVKGLLPGALHTGRISRIV